MERQNIGGNHPWRVVDYSSDIFVVVIGPSVVDHFFEFLVQGKNPLLPLWVIITIRSSPFTFG